MISDRLENFLLSWCNPDSTIEDAARMLQRPSNAEYQEWLPRELLAVVRSGELTPQALDELTGGGGFDTRADVDQWLREVWPAWFGRTYPD